MIQDIVNKNKVKSAIKRLVAGTGIIILTTGLNGQKRPPVSPLEILPDESVQTIIQDNKRINTSTGYPVNVRNLSVPLIADNPEAMTRNYLKSNLSLYGLTNESVDTGLRLHAIRNGLSGSVVRLRQYHHGIPVHQAEITVHINNDNKVTYVSNSLKYGLPGTVMTPVFSQSESFVKVREHMEEEAIPSLQDELVYFQVKNTTFLAYRHLMRPAIAIGEWEVFVDATDGSVLKARDVAFYHDHKQKKNKKATPDPVDPKKRAQPTLSKSLLSATGLVFDPDPLSSANATYGDPGFTDGGDADTPELSGERSMVNLQGIINNGGTYELSGPYASIDDFESPFKGDFSQATALFDFNRQEDGFEAVNVYYHIDASMRYMNETLGLNIMPYQYVGGVKYDPHGLNGSDNSHYISNGPNGGKLAFGEGGVDDAEDSDVIHHELGHGLHDWVTMGGLSQNDGLSEGSGDYWAASYNRSVGNWTPADPQYSWVFNWDGHNPFWGGRSVDYRPASPAYPGGLTGSIHTDGQIWGTCMMDVWDAIGKSATDIIFWEGLGMTNGGSDQDDAANAVYQAALDLNYSGTQLVAINDALSTCGYSLPAPPNPDNCDGDEVVLSGDQTTSQVYKGKTSILSTQSLTGNQSTVTYQANDFVGLDANFTVEDTDVLIIQMGDCDLPPPGN